MGLFLDPFWIRRSVLDPLRTPSEPQEASGAGSMGPFWDPFWIRSSDRAQSARIFVAFGDVFEARSDRVQLSLGSVGSSGADPFRLPTFFACLFYYGYFCTKIDAFLHQHFLHF